MVKVRMAKQLTQETVAVKAEISLRYLQFIEAGKKQPSINVVSRIRFSLGCSWEELLQGL